MRAALAILAVLWYSPAIAQAPVVTMVTETNDPAAIELEGTTFHYSGELGTEPKRIFISGMADGSLRYRYITQAAIAGEGPWWAFDGYQTHSTWKRVQAKPEGGRYTFDMFRDDRGVSVYPLRTEGEMPVLMTRAQVRKAIKKDIPENKDYWLEQSKSCFTPDGQFVTSDEDASSSCYLYVSEEQFLFKGADGKDYQLVIQYPGGC
jgi:hypothetical protein